MPDPSTNVRRSLDRQEVLSLLPYGTGFLFIESADHLGDREISTIFDWDDGRPDVSAHFRTGLKIVPGVFLIEQAAQSALLLAILEGEHAAGRPMMLCQVRCDIVAPACAPCRVTAHASVDAIVIEKVGFSARCCVGGNTVAKIRGIAAPMPVILR
jgi:3-hydroxymyristoyl/3-hydroxydecanoyl-(acyl carrier protein) dehydratase